MTTLPTPALPGSSLPFPTPPAYSAPPLSFPSLTTLASPLRELPISVLFRRPNPMHFSVAPIRLPYPPLLRFSPLPVHPRLFRLPHPARPRSFVFPSQSRLPDTDYPADPTRPRSQFAPTHTDYPYLPPRAIPVASPTRSCPDRLPMPTQHASCHAPSLLSPTTPHHSAQGQPRPSAVPTTRPAPKPPPFRSSPDCSDIPAQRAPCRIVPARLPIPGLSLQHPASTPRLTRLSCPRPFPPPQRSRAMPQPSFSDFPRLPPYRDWFSPFHPATDAPER